MRLAGAFKAKQHQQKQWVYCLVPFEPASTFPCAHIFRPFLEGALANVALSCQSFAKGRQLWGDSLEFQGAAFLLHRRAHLVSAELLGLVSNAAVAKSPEEFLKWVIEAELSNMSCATLSSR